MKIISRNKAVGVDCLPDNLYGSEEFTRMIHETVNSVIFKEGKMNPEIYTSRIVPLVKDSEALMNLRNIRLLTIQSMMIRVVEALVKNKLEPLIKDNDIRKKYMGNGQIGFVPEAGCDLHVYRLLRNIANK